MQTRSLADQASEAVELALSEPQRAAEIAVGVHAVAAAAGLNREVAMALRAMGLAQRALGNVTGAEESLRTAVVEAGLSGDTDLSAECQVSLAATLVLAGRGEEGLAVLDAAVAGPNTEVLLASQRAVVLSMLDRYEEALAIYGPVIAALRRAGDRVLEGRTLNSRGLVNVYLARFAQADADLARAEQLSEETGNRGERAERLHNRGWLAARVGDIPKALALYGQAAALRKELGVAAGVTLIDRAEALVAAGLVSEAGRQLELAIRESRAAGNQFGVAEGLLKLADCSYLAGDPSRSHALACEAAELFAEQQRWGWRALARAVTARAALGMGTASAESASQATDAALELDRMGLRDQALGVHAVAGKLWWETAKRAAAEVNSDDGSSGSEWVERAVDELVAASAGRRWGPAADRAVAWDAEGLRRLIAGDRSGALRALRNAVATVGNQQAALSATELRAHISLHADSSAALGLRLALEGGRPAQVFEWMERRRANSLRSWPLRPPSDPDLARDLSELRRLATEVSEAATTGRDPRPAARQAARLERAVRERSWTVGGSGLRQEQERGVQLSEIRRQLGERALVEIGEVDGGLHAVVVNAKGTKVLPVGARADITAEVERLRFSLRKGTYGMGGGSGGDDEVASRWQVAASRLDGLLFGTIARSIGGAELVLVPTGDLHALPWAALPSLAGRPYVVAPSAHSWFQADRTSSRRGSVVGVCGPNLPAAPAEVKALKAIYPHAEILAGRQAAAAAVLRRFATAEVVHVAAHATLNADNGMWSALQLVDGPLTVYELEGIEHSPDLVVLSACQSGMSTVRPGDELLGLVTAFLALGTKTVVASSMPVEDAATAWLMSEFHSRLAAGHPPALALSLARLAAQESGGPDRASRFVAGASFSCFGAS